MYRQDDWECTKCHKLGSHLVWVDHGAEKPKEVDIECTMCAAETKHERVLSMPAVYTYDRPYAPMVSGGKFDTEGHRKPPPLPELPDDASMDQARDYFATAEFKEIKEMRHANFQENAVKRARAKAMKSDTTIDLRSNPLPGDPTSS